VVYLKVGLTNCGKCLKCFRLKEETLKDKENKCVEDEIEMAK
jgi:hypothetical protein